MILAPTNRRIIRPYDKPSFEHTQRYGLIKGHWANTNRVGLWLFNEASGGQVFDLSRNRYHSTSWIGDPQWTSGPEGSVIHCNGVGDRIYFGSGVFNLQPITIIIKFQMVAYVAANEYVFGISDGEKISARFVSSANLRIQIADDVGYPQVNVDAVAGEWLVLAMTVDASGGYLRAYKNAVLQGTPQSVGTISFIDSTLTLGARYGGGLELDCEISYAMIYNRTLISSEITQLHRDPFLGVQREPRITYFFVSTAEGQVYYELNLTVTADAIVSESDAHVMVDTEKVVSADGSASESDTQQMIDTGKEVSADASALAIDAQTMIETGKVVTAIASPAVIDKQAMMETELGVSAEGSVSCIDTMGLLAHIAAFMILRQCT